MNLSRLGIIGLIFTLCTLTACASNTEIPTSLVTQAETSVRQAESAGADDLAPLALRDAKKNLASAKSAMAREDYKIAHDYLEKSLADSEVAVAQTHAEKSTRAAEEIKEQMSTLEKEVNKHPAH